MGKMYFTSFNIDRIRLISNFIAPDQTESLFHYFWQNLPWEQRENATPSGKKFLEPRQTCWYGLPYAYSQVKMDPNLNWDPKLRNLLNQVQKYSDESSYLVLRFIMHRWLILGPFNSVMCNLYEGAKNSIDWHADDEPSLGECPTIASVSLGTTRSFELCRRSELFTSSGKMVTNPYRERVKKPPFEGCKMLYRVFLEAGSLLIMSGFVQKHWLVRFSLFS